MLTVAPLVIKQIVDEVIGKQQFQLLLPYLGLLMLVMLVRAATTYFYSYGQNKLGQLVMTDVRSALYRKLLALPFSAKTSMSKSLTARSSRCGRPPEKPTSISVRACSRPA
jgi:ABC-type multidrug transport system fused ATPase/permease subunit